ncbi:MAG: hypothetical protein ACP5D2_01540 [Candidatus Nanoarchaeia archaeon]
MVRNATPYEKFQHDLIARTREEERCKYFRVDDDGPYCNKGLKEGEKISERRRMICDNFSLQLWCLDKARCHKCLYYQGAYLN